MKQGDIHTTESLFEVAETLLKLCREQNLQLAQLDALSDAEAQALQEAERQLRALQD